MSSVVLPSLVFLSISWSVYNHMHIHQTLLSKPAHTCLCTYTFKCSWATFYLQILNVSQLVLYFILSLRFCLVAYLATCLTLHVVRTHLHMYFIYLSNFSWVRISFWSIYMYTCMCTYSHVCIAHLDLRGELTVHFTPWNLCLFPAYSLRGLAFHVYTFWCIYTCKEHKEYTYSGIVDVYIKNTHNLV